MEDLDRAVARLASHKAELAAGIEKLEVPSVAWPGVIWAINVKCSRDSFRMDMGRITGYMFCGLTRKIGGSSYEGCSSGNLVCRP